MLHSKISKIFFVIVVIISLTLCAQTVIGSFRVVNLASYEVRKAVSHSEQMSSSQDRAIQEAERLNTDLDWVKKQLKK